MYFVSAQLKNDINVKIIFEIVFEFYNIIVIQTLVYLNLTH
jgi:hypothetical protein